MRTLVTALFGVLALAGSAFATNIALDSAAGGIASIYNYNGYLQNYPSAGDNYPATNAIDGSLSTPWVAPGGTVAPNPYFLVNLGQLYTVDSLTVDGNGNNNLTTSFDVFVGTLAALTAIETAAAGTASPSCPSGDGYCAEPLIVSSYLEGAIPWSQTGLVSTTTQIQYVLYIATNSSNSVSACYQSNCYPGSALPFGSSAPTSGQDDAAVNELLVDATTLPEPTTIGLVGITLLGLGFAKRRFLK